MATLTELPWQLPVVALPRTKILVVYNSNHAWTQGTCEYYCDQRGIPRENIIGVPAGTANLWIGSAADHNMTAAEFDNFLIPIAEALESGGHKAVILGPKFPSKITFRNFNEDGTMDTDPNLGSNYVTISASYVVSCAKHIAATRRVGWAIGGNGGSLVQINPDMGGYALIERITAVSTPRPAAYEWTNGGGLPSGAVPLADLPLWPTNGIAKMLMPSAAQQRELWSVTRPHVGVSRLGWSPGFHDNAQPTALPDETDENVRALIDRATSVMTTTDASSNRAKPHLIGISQAGQLVAEDMRSYYRQLVSWGIPTDYAYWYTSSTEPSPLGTDDPPFADAWGNLTTMGAGTVSPRPFQYFCLLGGGDNGSPDYFSNDSLNFDGNQEAMAGGNSLFSGASYTYVFNPYSISRGVAIAGMVDTVHQGGSLAMYAVALHVLLLRGMSYLEAMCWFNVTGNAMCLPIGDPLYVPYGRRSPFGMLGGVVDAEAVPDGPNPSNLTFGSLTNTGYQVEVVSEGVTLAGMFTPLPIRVSWGTEWSVTSASTGFTIENGTILPGQTLWLKHTTGLPGTTTESRVHVGTAMGTFTSNAAAYSNGVPTNAIVFAPRSGVTAGQLTESLGTKISAFDVPIEVSVSAGSEFRFTLAYPEVWYSTPQTVYPKGLPDGFTYVTVRHTAAATPETETSTTLTAGGVEGVFISTTEAATGTFTAELNTSTGVLTITDPSNGLGTKSPVAPYFFNPLDTVVDGTYSTDETVGFQIYNTEINAAYRPYVAAGNGIAGSKSIVMRCLMNDPYLNKPQITRLFTPVGQAYSNIDGGETTQFFMSYFLKLHQTVAQGHQMKLFRAAESEGSNANRTSTNANDYYGNYPNMACSIWFDSSGALYSNHYEGNDGVGSLKSLSATVSDVDRVPPAGSCLNDLQQCYEIWVKQNTGTSSNGELFIWQNGKAMLAHTAAKQQDNPVPFGHVMVFTGPDLSGSADFTYYLSRPYIDFTKQRVVLGDNSDFNACLIHFPLGLSGWTPGGITATDAKNIPLNCDYVFVLDANNNVVSNGGTGFAYSRV